MIGGVAILLVLTILPLSALMARRLPLASWIKMALVWVAIFVLLFVVVSLWQGATSARGLLGGLFQ